jgi:hypothetical protein
VPRREPFTLKQKLMIVATAFVLYLPMLLWIIYYSDTLSPRQYAALAAVNLVVGVSLLAFISEKWIRKWK